MSNISLKLFTPQLIRRPLSITQQGLFGFDTCSQYQVARKIKEESITKGGKNQINILYLFFQPLNNSPSILTTSGYFSQWHEQSKCPIVLGVQKPDLQIHLSTTKSKIHLTSRHSCLLKCKCRHYSLKTGSHFFHVHFPRLLPPWRQWELEISKGSLP